MPAEPWVLASAETVAAGAAAVSAAAVVIGGFIAWRALVWAKKSANAQASQLEMLEEERRRELASSFAVWWEFDTETGHGRVLYHNGGALPVFQVICTFLINNQFMKSDVRTVPPTDAPRADAHWTSHVEALIVELISSQTTADDYREKAMKYNPAPHLRRRVLVEVEFRDANNYHWIRETSGELKPTSARVDPATLPDSRVEVRRVRPH